MNVYMEKKICIFCHFNYKVKQIQVINHVKDSLALTMVTFVVNKLL
jgi:hypothetical protein